MVPALVAGLRVVAVARRKERLEALQARMSALGVPMTHFLPVVCDITKDAEVSQSAEGGQAWG
jgi:NADP-dependent 3-hydroxy acid dehydrogenase YdfG